MTNPSLGAGRTGSQTMLLQILPLQPSDPSKPTVRISLVNGRNNTHTARDSHPQTRQKTSRRRTLLTGVIPANGAVTGAHAPRHSRLAGGITQHQTNIGERGREERGLAEGE